MSKQNEILQQTARRHGLTLAQAEEIWNLFGAKIAETISKQDKLVDNQYDPEKFPVIHIDNFGKFIPNQRKLRHANYCLTLKTNPNEQELKYNI
jgi:nucleoid DNA-binding protein